MADEADTTVSGTYTLLVAPHQMEMLKVMLLARGLEIRPAPGNYHIITPTDETLAELAPEKWPSPPPYDPGRMPTGDT